MNHRPLILPLTLLLLGALLAACGGGEGQVAEETAATGNGAVEGQTVAADATAVEQESQETPTTEAEGEPFVPRRGCAACHGLVDSETGKYTLAYEAHERAEARGLHHPDVAPDGTSMAPTDEVPLETCLECHAPGEQPVLSMRDIVHPAHAFSETFVGEFRGNCFSCHTVSPEGSFDVISGSLEVNDKGVPEPPPREE
jgi:mono/diheme cytochrome c family protein